MKKLISRYFNGFVFGALLCLNLYVVVNFVLLKNDKQQCDIELINYQNKKLADSLIIYSNIAIHTNTLPIISIDKINTFKYKMLYRITSNMCESCIISGLDLYNQVLSKHGNKNTLFVIGDSNSSTSILDHNIGFRFNNNLTSFDEADIPYYLLVDENNNILFFIPVFLDNLSVTYNLLELINKTYFPQF